MVDAKRTGRVRRAVDRLGDDYLESYRAAVDHAFRVREGNARLTREFFTSHVVLMEEHAAHHERVVQETMRLTRKQSEALIALSLGGERKNPPPPRQP